MALLFEILVSVYTRFHGDASGLVSTPILPAARTRRKSEEFRLDRRCLGRVIIWWQTQLDLVHFSIPIHFVTTVCNGI